jgi:DNA-binding transcriptional MocR family regulator
MSEPFAYERLASDLSDQVQAGVLRPGDRVPSVRRMSRERGLSVTTVLQAYRLLEARRLLRARPQSGFYIAAPAPSPRAEPRRTQPPTVPTEVTTGDVIADVLAGAADKSLVPLGAALPDASLLPAARLNRLMGSVLHRDPARATAFMGPDGVEELRHEIAQREWTAGCRIGAEDVLVTCGGSEALALALRATTKPGDTVAVESPTFFGVLQTIETLGCRALEIPTDARTGMCLDDLERAMREHPVHACVVTPNFQNPLGALMPDHAKERLAELARTQEMPVIEDDTFGELYFEGVRPPSILTYDCDGWVIRCSSFSKTLAPGYRIGWIVPGERYHRQVKRFKHSLTIATAAPPQLAVAEYLRQDAFDHHLQRLRRIFRRTVERLTFEVLDRFPAGTRVSHPLGGFVVWVQLPRGVDANRVHADARRRGVGVSPGPIYSAAGQYRDCLRLSGGHPWSDRTARGLDALAEIVESLHPHRHDRLDT